MTPPTHRAYHSIATPRLLIRSAIPSDAQAIASLRGDPKNNPYTPVEPNLSAAVFEDRIRTWTAFAQEGKNAFMVIILLDNPTSSDGAGTLIGFGGFNCFEAERDSPTAEIVADTGAMIDHEYWGTGYAREAVCATVEYGLYTLGCGQITIETSVDNEPWRGLMRSIGLGPVERLREVGEEANAQQESVYRFGRSEWEKARQQMMASGKWMLDKTL
jgi:RimJ/RimL family protein N-acetyltransferase